jgi:hypothetical protein
MRIYFEDLNELMRGKIILKEPRFEKTINFINEIIKEN